GADRPRYVTHPECRQRSDGCHGRVARGKEDARKHQGGRSAGEEEGVVLQYPAAPGSYRRLLRRPYALRFVGALRLDDDFVHPELLGPLSGCEGCREEGARSRLLPTLAIPPRTYRLVQ